MLRLYIGLYVIVRHVSHNVNRYYTLVASKTLRPNSDFLVSVSMQNTSDPTFVVVEISGNQDSGGIFKATDSVSVEPFSTRIVRLEVRADTYFTLD